jgi:hypothetical protein
MTIQFNEAAAVAYEDEVNKIAARMEELIGDREDQKAFVESNYESTDNDADYSTVETKWLEAAEAARQLIQDARALMEKNTVTATSAHQRAGAAIGAMGM